MFSGNILVIPLHLQLRRSPNKIRLTSGKIPLLSGKISVGAGSRFILPVAGSGKKGREATVASAAAAG